MEFLGKSYTLEKNENFEEFIDNLGVPEDKKEALLTFKPSQWLKKEGDEFILSTTNPDGGIKDLKFKDGVEFDEDIVPGVVGKTTFNVDGNVVSQVQKFDDFSLSFKREYSSDQLVVTMTSSKWDGTARRYYKAA